MYVVHDVLYIPGIDKWGENAHRTRRVDGRVLCCAVLCARPYSGEAGMRAAQDSSACKFKIGKFCKSQTFIRLVRAMRSEGKHARSAMTMLMRSLTQTLSIYIFIVLFSGYNFIIEIIIYKFNAPFAVIQLMNGSCS